MAERVTHKGVETKERVGFVQSGKMVWLALGVMASALITGAAAWLIFGQDKVTREEMQSYVADRSVRVVDFVRVEEVAKSNADSISELQESVKELTRTLNTYFREQTKRDGKLESAIEIIKASIEAKKKS